MAIKLVLFPPEVQEFGREIHMHPELMNFIESLDRADREDLAFILAATGAYLNIPIDGYFTGQGMLDLIHDFVLALKKKRTEHIIPYIH